MKFFKYLDLIIQALLLSISISILLWQGGENRYFWFSYLLLGCWQMLGYLIQFNFHHYWIRQNNRVLYGKALVSIFLLGIFSCLLLFINIYTFWVYYIVLLVVSPLLIAFYFAISFLELKTIEFREMIHLK